MTETEPSSAVKWKAPPPARTRRYDWDKIATKLRRKPGEWALIFERDKNSLTVAIRNNDIKALTSDKGFEMRTANNTRETETEPRMCSLYLRYNPEKDVT